MTEPSDFISSEEPTRPLGRPTREASLAGAGARATAMTAALTLVIAAGVATAAYRSTSGGPSPTSLIPANAFAVATADLSLPGGQAGALETMLGRFPGLHLTGGGSIRDRVLRTMLQSADSSIDYDADLKPWLGDHIAIAGWNQDGKPEMEIVLQSTDDSAARSHLKDLLNDNGSVEMHNGYAVLGSSQSTVDEAIAAADKSSLDDAGSYAADIAALPGDEAITGWIDGPALKDTLAKAFGGDGMAFGAPLMFDGLGMFGSGLGDVFKGRTAVGVHVTDTVAELDMHSVGAQTTKSAPATMLTTLPEGTVGAVEFGDPGAVVDAVTPLVKFFGSFAVESSISCGSSGSITATPGFAPAPTSRRALLRQLKKSIPPGSPHRRAIIRKLTRQLRRAPALSNATPPVPTPAPMPDCYTSTTPPQPTDPFEAIQKAIGISFPDDVKTVLGDRAVVAFGGLELAGLPDVAIRTHPTDLASAQSLANAVSSHLSTDSPVQVDVSTAGDDLVLATSSTYGAQIAKAGALGEQEQVKDALAGMPDSVNVAGYVNLSRVWPLLGNDVPAGVQHLHAVGFWAANSGDVQTAQLRLVMG